MNKYYIIVSLIVFVTSLSMCNKAELFLENGYDERLSGGAATVFDATSHAFGNAMNGLTERDARVHELGDQTFSQTFVVPPSPIFTGLGPVFNNVSCVNCHRNDGEGIPTAGFSNSGLLVRLSLPGMDAKGGPLAVPGFGTQLQDQAVAGAQPEAKVNISYSDSSVVYPDGTMVKLIKPDYTIQNPYTTLPANCMFSPRLAPPLIGMGLLENIPERTILSFVDAGDKNGDGITGKANYVYDEYTKKTVLGRFGLKANTSTLSLQVATAYQQDMGITSYVQKTESADGQPQMDVVHGDVQPELTDSLLNYVVFYVKTLGVPARRNVTNADVKAGSILFDQINCSGCHRPTLQTGINLTLSQISNQRIHPYTDLLVHDMGPGLADDRPDFLASGNEWRTAPLWGRGLLDLVNGTPYFLHDGRARSFEEAILWHGGEAEKSKQKFMQLSSEQRNQLMKFLESL
ncbi:MAG TPA: di-heme oxidoredictase family protein [Puia sp.]|nr:di-heme oxidoredictase family protein [Puia sp.]